MTRNKNSGLTLIEMIIYIALFGILIGGVVAAVYGLAQGAGTIGGKVSVEEEGNFVLQKIEWAMSSASGVAGTNANCNSQTPLVINRYDGTTIDFRRNVASSTIEMSENGGVSYVPITSANSSTTCLQFQIVGTSPTGVVATTTINSIDFAITKYLRQ